MSLVLRLIQLKHGGLPDGEGGLCSLDHLVVDEAQDFLGLPHVLDIFQCLLGGNELKQSQWAIFGDIWCDFNFCRLLKHIV